MFRIFLLVAAAIAASASSPYHRPNKSWTLSSLSRLGGDDDSEKSFTESYVVRAARQVMTAPMMSPMAAAVPVFIPMQAQPTGPNLNETSSMMDSKLDSTKAELGKKLDESLGSAKDKMTGELSKKLDDSLGGVKDQLTGDLGKKLDDSLGNVKGQLSGDMDKKLEHATNQATGVLQKQLDEKQGKLIEKMQDSDARLEQQLTDTSEKSWAQMRESNEKLDAIRARLDAMNNTLSSSAATGGWCRAGSDGNLTLTDHHRQLHSELATHHAELMRAIDELRASIGHESTNLAESIKDTRKKSEHEQQVQKDKDILENIDVRIEVPDEENPSIGRLLPLTPIVTARKLRQIWNAQMGKGMVSVCYHNQPQPLSELHPLVPDDDPVIRSIFNGTMDSAHNLQAGLDLNVPSYINSLLMEVRALDRRFISLCLEDPDHDVEFYHKSSCMNLVVSRKGQA